jgi:diguanylate cyclase (GGDEF)-like protein/hemerythrin-like metal-binding protein
MLAPMPLPIPAVASALPIAIQSFLAGILMGLAILSMLAYGPLRDRILSKTGLFGLMAAATWITFSDIAFAILPPRLIPWIHPASLTLAGLSLAGWERVMAGLLASSRSARRLVFSQRFTTICALVIVLGAWPPWEPVHRLSELVLGFLAPLLALLTLLAGLRARREGLDSAGAVAAAALALLVCCLSLGALSLGWKSRLANMVVLQLALLVLAMALGWVMLRRMRGLRRSKEAAQATKLAAAARQSQDLERMVQERNAELSERLRDLDEARRSAELANQALQRALEQVEQAASTDRLTGAWNRRRFEEAVTPEIALAHRRREPLALLMFDLDHFKRVNDTFGHGAGDAVLAGTAQAVREHLRLSDSLVRWGGEEFLVMAPATRLEGAMGLAEKLRASVAAMEFPGVGHVTMSLGVSEYALGESLGEWIDRTDKALYRAKSEGRNCAVSALPSERVAHEPSARGSLLEVIWEDIYASGNATIDNQHQQLFRMASALMTTLTENRPLAEVSLRLETLVAHTAQHFHDEEGELREARFPDLPAHAKVHAALLNKAWELQAEVQAGKLDFGKLVSYLALDLVKGHILTEDRAYFSFIRRGSPPPDPAGPRA